MISFAQIRRNGKLALAAVALGASLLVTPANADVIASNGAWATITDGNVTGVATSYADGSMLSLAVIDGKFHLLLKDPAWNLRIGRRVPMAIAIDGDDRFVGTAEAVGHDVLDVEVDNTNFLRGFVHGQEASISVLGARWDASLDGSYRATAEMINAIER